MRTGFVVTSAPEINIPCMGKQLAFAQRLGDAQCYGPTVRTLTCQTRREGSRLSAVRATAGFNPARQPNLQQRLSTFLATGQGKATAAAVVVGSLLVFSRSASGGGAGRGGGSGSGSGGGGGGPGGSGPNGASIQAPGRDDNEPPKKLPLVTLTLVSFAVTRKAYQRITERFAAEYEAQTGQAIKWRLSFGGSGTQARAIVDGLPGDIVALALPLDVQKIADAELIAADWQQRAPHHAVVAESVVAIVTRKGNPKNIRGWADLTRQDVTVVTANPKTAGVARWNFLALWGHKAKEGDAACQDFVTKVFERVPVQPRDAREASDVFYKQNIGDALLNYENEVVLTNEMYGADAALPYIVPDNNVNVQTPVAVVDTNVQRRSSKTKAATIKAAHAFVDYLYSPGAQADFAAAGFRPVDPKARKAVKLPKVKGVWRVEDRYGDWDVVQARFFGAGSVMDEIQNHLGELQRQKR